MVITHYKKRGRTREWNQAIEMKGRKKENERSARGMETLFYGMSGVGNSTISTDCFIKRGFIQRVVDGNREKGY